jgi:hypothetical protein
MRLRAWIPNRLKPFWLPSAIVGACFLALALSVSAQKAPSSAVKVTTFDTAEQAAEALVAAAEKYDVPALEQMLGPDGHDLVVTAEPARDKQQLADFAAQAREKMSVAPDAKVKTRAILSVGKEDWPLPIPIVKRGAKWSFDAKAGRQEVLFRRIGRNELDAIQICEGYVEAQHEYALKKREGYDVHQYAQRILSTPGKQDGLAWQKADGSWEGPVGENVARAIAQGYTPGAAPQPYHGYYFKVLKGQGPAAPLGKMDFVVNGAMIGGFALVAAPAQYQVTGVKTFMVSYDGVVYEKDFGPKTLDQVKQMELFNPDKTWNPVKAQ